LSELRWNPILREWVIVATHRQDRPLMPTKTCPFCVGSEEVPKNYDLLVLPNRFPSLHECPPAPDIEGDDFYRVAPAKGYCEVVLYSSEHNTTLAQQSNRRILNLILLSFQAYHALFACERSVENIVDVRCLYASLSTVFFLSSIIPALVTCLSTVWDMRILTFNSSIFQLRISTLYLNSHRPGLISLFDYRHVLR
jgi:hypothetical protein